MAKKIAIIGSHSTGKTTLIAKLKDHLTTKGLRVAVIQEVIRTIAVPANEMSTVEAQCAVIDHQIKQEQLHEERQENSKQYDIILCDRSVLDNYAYLYRINQGDHYPTWDTVKKHISSYSLLLYKKVDPSMVPVDDGFRSTDIVFQRQIQDIITAKLGLIHKHLEDSGVEVVYDPTFEQALRKIWP